MCTPQRRREQQVASIRQSNPHLADRGNGIYALGLKLNVSGHVCTVNMWVPSEYTVGMLYKTVI